MNNKRVYDVKHLLIGLLILFGVPIVLGFIFSEPTSISSPTNTSVVQSDETKKIQAFVNSVYKIDNAMSKEWDEIHANIKSNNQSYVDSQLQVGLDAMLVYKEQINNLAVPSLSDRKTIETLEEVKQDLSTAYGHGSIYFAFLRRMISSNDISDINAAQAGAQSENKIMLEYKAKATAKIDSLL